MKGGREFLISFAVGLASFTLLVKTFGLLKDVRRDQQIYTPVVYEKPQETESPAKVLRTRPIADREVVVAIIDTGCDVHHPALAANLWNNPGETGLDENGMSKATNGIDDDDNGMVDDVHGWSFTGNDNDLSDEHGHGTHIAGIIGQQIIENPKVRLMIVKYYTPSSHGLDNLKNTIQAIRYAVRMGAKIINYSGGGILKSSEEEAVIKWADNQGVLVVAAAGNEGMNSDFFHFYPADYDLDNILSVGAIDGDGKPLPISNYGRNTVDLVAPGKNIYSALPNGQYGFMTGTSQATAFVTAAAAQVMQSGDPSPKAVIQALLENGTESPSLRGRSRSGSILNAEAAIQKTGRAPARTAAAD